MKLAAFVTEGTAQVGVVIGETVVPEPGVTDMIDLITRWNAAKPAANAADGVALSSIRSRSQRCPTVSTMKSNLSP